MALFMLFKFEDKKSLSNTKKYHRIRYFFVNNLYYPDLTNYDLNCLNFLYHIYYLLSRYFYIMIKLEKLSYL